MRAEIRDVDPLANSTEVYCVSVAVVSADASPVLLIWYLRGFSVVDVVVEKVMAE